MTRHAIRLPDGRFLGRYSVHGEIVPVPMPFAHTFTDLAEAESHLAHAHTVLGFPEAELATLPETPTRPTP